MCVSVLVGKTRDCQVSIRQTEPPSVGFRHFVPTFILKTMIFFVDSSCSDSVESLELLDNSRTAKETKSNQNKTTEFRQMANLQNFSLFWSLKYPRNTNIKGEDKIYMSNGMLPD